ncbi:MAG: ABC transporter permease [Deltaproteobacteria bacterium]|nr:ABC transporter permease [Deltaproteobacteria bacterium]MBI2230738.1 ABC transporter permease [Deltaproteobacteria bacterium]MBI2533482.1 ABC transporter permease [Deltaproteobacteria bacterium]
MLRLRYFKVMVGGIILAGLVICGLAAPLLAPFDPQEQRLESRLQAPAWLGGRAQANLLGTDNLGRDILSRVVYGSRISLLVGATTVILAGLVGCFLGAVAGYFGRRVDEVVGKITEIFLAFPFLLLAIALMAFLGQGVINIIIALMVSRWVQYCRVVRGEVLSLKERDFVTAAKALGARDYYVLLRHVMPNTFASVTVVATFAMAIVIISEASLSFLGLGVPAHIPTWGSMLSEGRSYMNRAPWLTIFPGMAIFVTVFGINLLGDGLRDILDPKLRRQI